LGIALTAEERRRRLIEQPVDSTALMARVIDIAIISVSHTI
jgi:hypothetical protein